jgi:small subunit ribosomal protein S21
MEVKLKNKDGRSIPLERALRIFKRRLDKEGTIKEIRNRRFYEKKSTKKYKKNQKAKYAAKMQAKEDELWR